MILIKCTDPWNGEPIVINIDEISSIVKANPWEDDSVGEDGYYNVRMKSGLEITVKESASEIFNWILKSNLPKDEVAPDYDLVLRKNQ